MPFTLYDAFVPTVRQLLGAQAALIDKAEEFAGENGVELIGARLAEDMWPLPWHVRSCWVHSAYALDQLGGGAFTPDFTDIPDSWDAMRSMVAAADARMTAATAAEIDAFADRDIPFILGGQTRFTLPGERFLLGFSLPNFQFHATTFYDILRAQGVRLGKRDFLGNPAGPTVQR